ncbi:protein disulfide isomerase MPD1, partial [Ascoidea rubescens DSM 1968]
LCFLFASLSLGLLALADDGFYSSSEVYELSASTFKEVILDTNYTSIVEFYAPWCGHCQRLKGTYKKIARGLKDIVNVAAINCDLNKNKKVCAEYLIEGFPTLMVFRPPKYDVNSPVQIKHSPANEKYLGERNFKSISDFLLTRLKNYVKRLSLKNIDKWVKDTKNNNRIQVVLVTDKDKASNLLKSLAIDYLSILDF